MTKVWLTEWKSGLKKVSLTKLLQAKANLSLKIAKELVDRFLDGEKVAIEMSSPGAAKMLVAEASKLGAVAEVDGR